MSGTTIEMMKKNNIFTRVWNWLKETFARRAEIIRDAKRIVAVMRYINQAVNSSAATAVVDLIPGKTDDRILQAIRSALERILKIVDQVEKLPSGWPVARELQSAVLHKTASMALRDVHGMDEVEADQIIQDVYTREKLTQG